MRHSIFIAILFDIASSLSLRLAHLLSSPLQWASVCDFGGKETSLQSHHIDIEARLIYRRIYGVCDVVTGYVRPFVEYATPVWDPHLMTRCKALEKVQKLTNLIFFCVFFCFVLFSFVFCCLFVWGIIHAS